jgi:hypothetical protein
VKKILKYFDSNATIGKYYYNLYKIRKPIERVDFSAVIFLNEESFLLDNKNTLKLCEDIMTLCKFPKEDISNNQINNDQIITEGLGTKEQKIVDIKANDIGTDIKSTDVKTQIHTMAEVLSESHCIASYDELKNTLVVHFYSCLGPNSGVKTVRSIEKRFGLVPVRISMNEIIIDPIMASKSADIKMQEKKAVENKLPVSKILI